VVAIDNTESSLGALTAAIPSGWKIRCRKRDLFRDPLSPVELESFGAVVLDPPRAGAAAQMAALAKARVPQVILVSCNPGTFARDARSLRQEGWQLTNVVPIDQFPWSGHLEVVGRFVR
jgi:23S rRNA (uracil1939-C5)-methyltransferase